MLSPEGIDVSVEHLLNPISSNEDYQSLFVRNSMPTYMYIGANNIHCIIISHIAILEGKIAIFSIHIVCTYLNSFSSFTNFGK